MTARETKETEAKALLVESVRRLLVPVFIERGFAIVPRRLPGGEADRRYTDMFPLDEMRREMPDGGVDLIEVQFAPRNRAALRINATAVPKNGMVTAGGHRTASQLHGGGLHDHFETHARPWLRWGLRVVGLEPLGEWFSLWPLPGLLTGQNDYDRLVLRVVEIVPEVEMALREGKLGPHVRRVAIKTLSPKVLERVRRFNENSTKNR